MRFIRKYGSLIFLLLRIAIVIAVPFLVIDSLSAHNINGAEYAKYYDGWIYGLECDERADYLFKYNVNGSFGRFTKTHDIYDITLSEDGKLYMLQKKDDNAKILRWKDNGFISTVVDVAQIEGMEPQRILSSNKGIFYIYYTDESGEEIRRLGYNEEWKPVGAVERYRTAGFKLADAELTDNGRLYFVDGKGSVYGACKDAEPELIFDVANGPEDNMAYTNYRFTPYNFTFTNIRSNKNYSISVTGSDYTPKQINSTYKAAKTFDDFRLRKVNYTGDDTKAGCLSMEDGSRGAAVCGSVEVALNRIEWPTLWYIIGLLIVAGLLVLIFWLLRKPLQKLEDKMLQTDISILISVTIILMIICLLAVNFVIVSYLKAHQVKQAKNTSLTLADQVVQELKDEGIAALSESGDTQLTEKYAEQGILMAFYTKQGDEYYYASEDRNRDVPADMSEPGLGSHIKATLDKAIEKEKVVHTQAKLDGVRYAGIAVPLGNLFNAPSVIFMMHPIQEFWKEFLSEVVWVLLINMGIWFAIFATIIYVLKRLEKQLEGLMDASARVLAGDLGAQADDRGINEVAAAIRTFNRMSRKLKAEEDSVANCEIMTRAFTPIGLMKQINGGFTDVDVTVGAEVRGRAQVLGIILEWDGKGDAEEQKEYGYKIIERFVAALSVLGGSIMDASFFMLRYVDAEMTRDLFRVVAPLIREINMGEGLKVRAVAHVTDVQAKIVGTGEYMILDVFETRPKGTKELFLEARQKDIAFLVTDFAAKVAGMKNHHFRRVGVFHDSPVGRGCVLFEALDADSQDDARKRINTQHIFEAGLNEYYSGDLARARRSMAEVLIEDNNDTVARFFLKDCESFNTASEVFAESPENTGKESLNVNTGSTEAIAENTEKAEHAKDGIDGVVSAECADTADIITENSIGIENIEEAPVEGERVDSTAECSADVVSDDAGTENANENIVENTEFEVFSVDGEVTAAETAEPVATAAEIVTAEPEVAANTETAAVTTETAAVTTETAAVEAETEVGANTAEPEETEAEIVTGEPEVEVSTETAAVEAEPEVAANTDEPEETEAEIVTGEPEEAVNTETAAVEAEPEVVEAETTGEEATESEMAATVERETATAENKPRSVRPRKLHGKRTGSKDSGESTLGTSKNKKKQRGKSKNPTEGTNH